MTFLVPKVFGVYSNIDVCIVEHSLHHRHCAVAAAAAAASTVVAAEEEVGGRSIHG